MKAKCTVENLQRWPISFRFMNLPSRRRLTFLTWKKNAHRHRPGRKIRNTSMVIHFLPTFFLSFFFFKISIIHITECHLHCTHCKWTQLNVQVLSFLHIKYMCVFWVHNMSMSKVGGGGLCVGFFFFLGGRLLKLHIMQTFTFYLSHTFCFYRTICFLGWVFLLTFRYIESPLLQPLWKLSKSGVKRRVVFS